MYSTSDKWKNNIYKNTQCVMNIYIDDELINPDYILEFKKGGDVFDKELVLGSTASQYIEMKIYKNEIISNPSKIKVEYGILLQKDEESTSEFEIIPIGIYNVDDYIDNDDDTITIQALDNMIKFEFNYDGSELINKKRYATLAEVAEDICLKAEVELRFYFFFKL